MGGPTEGLGGVGRTFRRARKCMEVLSEVWEWSRGPLGALGVVGRPFQRARSFWESPKEGQEEREAL